MGREIILSIIFWVLLIFGAVSFSVRSGFGGSWWDPVFGFVTQGWDNDLKKRDIAVKDRQKFLKGYSQFLKDLYGTKFVMAKDAADLAQGYAAVIRAAKQRDSGDQATGALVKYVDELNGHVEDLRNSDGAQALSSADDVVATFRNLEKKLKDLPPPRETFEKQIEKLEALKARYARGMERLAAQNEKVRALTEKVRSLNERVSNAGRGLSDTNVKALDLQDRMRSKVEAAQDRSRSNKDDLDNLNQRLADQRARMDALREKMGR